MSTAAATPDDSPHSTWRQRMALAIIPLLASLVLRLIGTTLRYSVTIEDPAGVEFSPRTIYAFWHQCLFTASYRYRNRGISVLISRSFDGELIARVVGKVGYRPVRGSSSRGAVAGLLEMARELEAGHAVAFTVDGPRGPRFVAKPGPLLLSRTQNAPVRALHFAVNSAWRLNSWDGFIIPKPFSHVVLRMAAPLQVPPAAGEADLEKFHAELQRRLDACREFAESEATK